MSHSFGEGEKRRVLTFPSTSNILSLPFRKSAHLSLASTIRQYINTKYDQHPDMFRNDLEVIDALRRDAVNIREPHPAGATKLQGYAAQLAWIGGKFPIDVSALRSWKKVFVWDALPRAMLKVVCGRSAPNLHGTRPWATTRSDPWSATT
jgi:hypothetical protein